MQEIWKRISFEPLYEVSNMGRIKRTLGGNILKGSFDKNKYVRVICSPSRKTYKVHRLVMRVFAPDGIDETVNHKNGDKTDNRLENLEWCSREENNMHSETVLGRYRPNSKLTEADVIRIRSKEFVGLTQSDMGKVFGVDHRTINYVINNKTWKHVV